MMLRRLRALLRNARRVPGIRGLIAAADRFWWARVIKRADVVDLGLVTAQGGPRTARGAIRAYVRGGFRTGMSLNPLFMEQYVSRQLSDADRVPAMYAYLVNHVATIATSVSWDATQYAIDTPEALHAPGGPVGHAWRHARTSGALAWGSPPGNTDWERIIEATKEGAGRARTTSAESLPRLAASTVVLCLLGAHEADVARALTTTVEASRRLDATLVVMVGGHRADVWIQATQLPTWLPGTVVTAGGPESVATVEAAMSDGATLVVRGPGADITAEDLVRLAAAGRDAPSAPVWLAPDGTVASAGGIRHDGRLYRLLSGHPAEDARRLGDIVYVAALDGQTWASPIRASAVPPRTILDLTVRGPFPDAQAESAAHIPGGHPDTDLDALLRPSGLALEHWSRTGPVLIRRSRSTTLPDGSTVPALRWAIKIVAPPGRPGEAWGDTHFARGIADALRRLGQEVVIDAYDARLRPSGYLDDVVLALRGPEPFEPQQGALSILWVISHPDQVTAEEVAGFDAVFAGSRLWADRATTRFGRPILPLLQCTDALRFRPSGAPRSGDLVFVGTARGIARPSVVEPLRAGIPISVYGPDWRGYIPGSAIQGRGVPNSELPALYETARAVMNDHWPAMREHGFISNRLYDVVAAGGRAVSDCVEGISEIFGEAVLTYQTIPELLQLLSGEELERRFPAEDELAHISARVRQEHSFDARARTLLDSALQQSASHNG